MPARRGAGMSSEEYDRIALLVLVALVAVFLGIPV